MPNGPFNTLEDLQEHLQWALELEHFTLPPYLCALYSIDPARNPEAEEVMRSVVLEEMLHMTLVANILNATGGRPRIDTPRMLVRYPACMPHGDRSFEVPLLPFCPEALDVFMTIERPASPCAPPEGDAYETISQFYAAIECGLRELCARYGEARVFCGAPSRQVTGRLFAGVDVRAIDSMQAALAALDEIMTQGEGAARVQVWDGDPDVFHPGRDQVAHYYRFEELKLGRRYRRGDTPQSGPTGERIAVDWSGIRKMRPNPRSDGSNAGTAVYAAQREFDLTYNTLLAQLDQTFGGSPRLLMTAVGTMFKLKGQAEALMQLPIEDELATAGPTFEYIPPEHRAKPVTR